MPEADLLGTRNVPPSTRETTSVATTNEIAVRRDLNAIDR
jgi:hypothetical protein